MSRPNWVPEGIDVNQPSAARIYDYWLGGTHNFAADREVARSVTAAIPDTARIMQANRAFLRRAVTFLVGCGVRQFLDLGSGIPTLGNVHEVAQRGAPDARVVYVDADSVAVAHSRHILTGNPNADVIQADIRDSDRILSDVTVNRLLDLDKPLAVLMMAVLHFIPDSDDPAMIVARFRDAIVPGSYLVISHGTQDPFTLEAKNEGSRQFERTTTPFITRTKPEVGRLFEGFKLVEPGLVWSVEWRAEHPDEVWPRPERCAAYAGVGVKR